MPAGVARVWRIRPERALPPVRVSPACSPTGTVRVELRAAPGRVPCPLPSMPPMSSQDLLIRIRSSLQPRYDVERELAASASGAVFLATDVGLRRRVVIKVLQPELASQPGVARRFVREARILASLNHPSVVAIHETGEVGDFRYYVRDFLEGEPLSQRLVHRRLSAAEAAHLCRDLLGALGAAHNAGVIHRALRPANIFCLGDRYVLADFEVARRLVSREEEIPPPDWLSTLRNMPLLNSSPDARSALAVTCTRWAWWSLKR